MRDGFGMECGKRFGVCVCAIRWRFGQHQKKKKKKFKPPAFPFFRKVKKPPVAHLHFANDAGDRVGTKPLRLRLDEGVEGDVTGAYVGAPHASHHIPRLCERGGGSVVARNRNEKGIKQHKR